MIIDIDEQVTKLDGEQRNDFEALLNQHLSNYQRLQGAVVKGTVLSVDDDMVTIDVGLKTEGRVALKEFTTRDEPNPNIKVDDIVDIFVERIEDRNGEAVLSRERARREEVWIKLEEEFLAGNKVNGVISSRVKGGFTVDIDGTVAFLPGSQVDIRPIRDVSPLMDQMQPFIILKMDRERGNIVVSRRAILEESRTEQRDQLIETLHEGQILDGIVKNITDYGAFIDLGGMDGLLHVTDIAWRRISHPSEVLIVGDTIKVQVVRFNQETKRVSLGMKQLEKDPWEVAATLSVGTQLSGRITNITDYGAFVEINEGIEGLVHISEMSWSKSNLHPSKIVSRSQEVQVQILEIDAEKRRISLGMKQCLENPWDVLTKEYVVGSVLEGQIRNVTDFGLFIGISEDIDGLVHQSDLTWEEDSTPALANYHKGDSIKVKILEINMEKQRIALGVKQLTENPATARTQNIAVGDVVTCTVTTVSSKGLDVSVNNETPGFIRRSDLSRNRAEQRVDRFAEGEKVDATIMAIDYKSGTVTLSIKVLETAEEQKAMEAYGTSDSGASLGDILGAALQKHQQEMQDPAKQNDGDQKPKAKTTKAKPKKADTVKADTIKPATAKPKVGAKKAATKKAPVKKAAAKKAPAKKVAKSDE